MAARWTGPDHHDDRPMDRDAARRLAGDLATVALLAAAAVLLAWLVLIDAY